MRSSPHSSSSWLITSGGASRSVLSCVSLASTPTSISRSADRGGPRRLDQLDAGPQAATADLFDGGQVRGGSADAGTPRAAPTSPGTRRSEASRSPRRPIAQATGLPPNVLPCSPGLNTPRIAVVGDDGRHRHDAAAERLAEDEHVGRTPSCSHANGRPGAPEPGLDLVGDEQHAPFACRARARAAGSPRAGRSRRPRPGSARPGRRPCSRRAPPRARPSPRTGRPRSPA